MKIKGLSQYFAHVIQHENLVKIEKEQLDNFSSYESINELYNKLLQILFKYDYIKSIEKELINRKTTRKILKEDILNEEDIENKSINDIVIDENRIEQELRKYQKNYTDLLNVYLDKRNWFIGTFIFELLRHSFQFRVEAWIKFNFIFYIEPFILKEIKDIESVLVGDSSEETLNRFINSVCFAFIKIFMQADLMNDNSVKLVLEKYSSIAILKKFEKNLNTHQILTPDKQEEMEKYFKNLNSIDELFSNFDNKGLVNSILGEIEKSNETIFNVSPLKDILYFFKIGSPEYINPQHLLYIPFINSLSQYKEFLHYESIKINTDSTVSEMQVLQPSIKNINDEGITLTSSIEENPNNESNELDDKKLNSILSTLSLNNNFTSDFIKDLKGLIKNKRTQFKLDSIIVDWKLITILQKFVDIKLIKLLRNEDIFDYTCQNFRNKHKDYQKSRIKQHYNEVLGTYKHNIFLEKINPIFAS